jgi:molecular chaperone GrpE
MNQEHTEFDSQELSQNPAESDSQSAEIEALRAEIALVRADALRERADLENQRKRVARDVDNARKFANEKLLGDLLPVFDSLDAGLTAAGSEPSPLRDGLELTYSRQWPGAAGSQRTAIQPGAPSGHQPG